MKLLFSLIILIYCFIPLSSSALPTDCIGSDDKMHVLDHDPQNGNNIVIDGVIYRPMYEGIIVNKKVSTYVDDSGIISNVILMIDPKTNTGDIYIVVYADTKVRRDRMKLNLQCSISG